MIKVNVQEAKTHLSRYLDQVENGDVVVVCRHNKPIAELRAVQTAPARPQRVAGLLKGRIHWEPDAFAEMTAEELADFDGAAIFPLCGPGLKLLLDTCAFLWFQEDSPHLSPSARVHLMDAANEVHLSAVSAWEIGRKYAQGKISLPSHPSILIPAVREASGIASLSLTEADALAAEKLQFFHKDPFDRMLIAQAIMGGLAIVTPDRAFEAYPVRLIW